MRPHDAGESFRQSGHNSGHVIGRQGRLGDVGKPFRIADDEPGHVVERGDQGHVLRFAQRALGLVVAGMADHDDLVSLLGEAAHLVVHLGDEGAGGVYDLQVAPGRF